VYSNKGKFSDSVGKPKDKIDILEKSGIYQIKCQGCDAVYIGQTRRNATARFKEYLRNIKYNRLELSSVANHVLEQVNEPNSNHTINFDKLFLLKEIRKTNQLEAYESFFIMKLRKQNHELINGDDGNIKSRLFDLLL
jgi:hypothetical protein